MQSIDVLFLCESNAALSLIAEALVHRRGDPRVRAFSAGRVPAGCILEEARAALAAAAIPADGLEPKTWTIFALPGARRPDVVIDLATVTWTDPRIGELATGPILRWPLSDPALADGRRTRRGLAAAAIAALSTRIDGDLFARLAAPRAAAAPGHRMPLALAG